jgi:hypothetical protein
MPSGHEAVVWLQSIEAKDVTLTLAAAKAPEVPADHVRYPVTDRRIPFFATKPGQSAATSCRLPESRFTDFASRRR